MAHICRRAVAVIRQDVEHDRSTARAVALVENLLVIAALCRTKPLLDGAIDIVLRDIVRLCLGKRQLQAHIARWVTAAHADGNRDLTPNLCGDLSTNGIICALLAFDICPF